MEDIRVKTAAYTLDGHTYTIRCNMNVLADVQEAYGGNLTKALNTASGLKGILAFLAAMLNDAADTEKRPERFTARELGRALTINQTLEAGKLIMPLIRTAVVGDEPAEEAAEDEKN